MAEIPIKDKLLPSLLDRLTDDEPNRTAESRELRIMSMQDLRNAVKRDLQRLLSTVNLEFTMALTDYPKLRSTVINYGISGLAGHTINHDEKLRVQTLIKSSILAFEPRILSHTVRVSLIEETELQSPHSIVFQIEGTLWGNPVPEPLFLRTELDLELGDVKVMEA